MNPTGLRKLIADAMLALAHWKEGDSVTKGRQELAIQSIKRHQDL